MKLTSFATRISRILTALTVALAISAATAPITYHVDSAAAGGGTGGASDPFNTIGAAVTAINGDAGVGQNEGTVLIAGGTYSSSLNGGQESLGAAGIEITKYMTIKGGYAGGGDWSDTTRAPRSTVIDLTNAGSRAFYQNISARNSGTLFDGLSIINANHSLAGGAIGTAGGYGVGMFINDCLFEDNTTTASAGAVSFGVSATSGTITDSDFIGNHADANGGAVYWGATYTATHLLDNCTFEGNSADVGGAVYVSPGSNSNARPRFEDCTFEGNTAASMGGAIFSRNGEGTEPVEILRSSLTGNAAPQGAAIGGQTYWHGEYYIENSLIAGNTGGYAIHAVGNRVSGDYAVDIAFSTIVDNPGGGMYVRGDGLGLRVRGSIVAANGGTGINYNQTGNAAILDYNDVWNQTADYAGDAIGVATNSLSVDPVFRGTGDNPYLLRTISPLLDAAADLGIGEDYFGDVRPIGSGFAMGAFEAAIPEPTSALLLGLALVVLCRRR